MFCGTLYALAERFRQFTTFAVPLVWLGWLLTLPPRPSLWLTFWSGLLLLAFLSWQCQRGHPGRWVTFIRHTADWHVLAVVMLFALAVQCEDAHGVTTDGVIYFTQLRSAIFDGDLDVAAEFAYLGQPPRPSHVVPIGPTLVWLPLYLIVAVADWSGRSLSLWSAPADALAIGLTSPYIRAALVSSWMIGAAGLATIHGRLRREFGPRAVLATLLVFGATPLVWYMVYEPSMTHAASFGFVAFFVVAAERWTTPAIRARRAVALGALLGLAFITRSQEAIFALLPAIILATAPATVRARAAASARMAGWAFLGALPFLLLQAAHSAVLFAREDFSLVSGSNAYLDFGNSRWTATLWSSWHGFFTWTPVAYIAAIGCIFYARRNRAWSIAALLILFSMALINGSTADWNAGWSFGGRRFTSVLTVLAPGIALVVHTLIRRPVVSLVIIAVAATWWNHLLVAQQQRGLLAAGEQTSFAHVIRQQAALATEAPFFYPFAFPANALYAWRTGMPLETYDLLGSETLREGIAFEMTADADRYLTSGWGARVSDPFGSLRWVEGDRAELLLPLDVTRDREVVVSWTARTRRLQPPELATFALVINGKETFRFTPDTDQSSHFSFTVPPGQELWVQGFNRIAFERRAGAPPVGIYSVKIGG